MANYRVNLKYLQGSDTYENVFYLQIPASISDALINAVGEYLHAYLVAADLWQHTSISAESFQIYAWDGTEWILNVEAPIVWHGTGDSEAANQQMAVVLSSHTGVKRQVAKKFVPGLIAAVAPQGVLTSSAMADFIAKGHAWIDIFTPSSGPTITPAVWRKAGNTYSTLPAVSVGAVVGSQRRRKQGVGI